MDEDTLGKSGFPKVLTMRERAEVINGVLAERLDTVLPLAMRKSGLDMWLIICQEDDLDPVYETMIPMDTWCPILQMLIFYDRGPGEVSSGSISPSPTPRTSSTSLGPGGGITGSSGSCSGQSWRRGTRRGSG
ncbi:MAG TPA: hypothetical protein VM050_12555 [Patescibacteria group bacterium]|nr:hypothetical protein [Patescibacteria group bacterium]